VYASEVSEKSIASLNDSINLLISLKIGILLVEKIAGINN
tara:strand:+ start:31090 stop:31209 length:120 start_codon:yes stop_codon:yes gene_type:complete